jgi:carbon storage regulator
MSLGLVVIISFYQKPGITEGIDMLVLTRKRSEMIHIGEDILIKVIRTGRSSVKIGIEAPDDIRVLRGELYDKLNSNGKPAMTRVGKANVIEFSDIDHVPLPVSDQFPHSHIA